MRFSIHQTRRRLCDKDAAAPPPALPPLLLSAARLRGLITVGSCLAIDGSLPVFHANRCRTDRAQKNKRGKVRSGERKWSMGTRAESGQSLR